MTRRRRDGENPLGLRRFFARNFATGEMVVLDAEQSRHLSRVLRLGVGARVVLFDGRGKEAEAEVQSLQPAGVVLKVVQELKVQGESGLSLTLGLGLAKGDAMDKVVSQATEMGVRKICAFISSRSERVSAERAARRLARWQRLSLEALKSCRRSYAPEIGPIMDFAEVLPGPEEEKLLFWEEAEPGGIRGVLSGKRPESVRLLIGPEGGFGPEEVSQAQEQGYRVVSLGPRRLKVETAALAALTILQLAWGDLS